MDKKQHFPLRRRIFTGMKLISGVMTLLSVAALFAVIIYVFADGTDKLSFDLLFGSYTDTPSILPAFVGTLELILIAGVIAIPLGIATAVFLAEYTDGESTLVRLIRIAVETLAAIPSIVYGLFGYLVFVVACGWGYSLLGGGITLAIMILPVIVRSTEESLRSVPVSYREGAYALGAGKAIPRRASRRIRRHRHCGHTRRRPNNLRKRRADSHNRHGRQQNAAKHTLTRHKSRA